MPLKPNDPHLPGWTALGTQKVAVLWMSDKADGGKLKAADGSLFLDLSGYSTQATAVPNVGNVFGGVRLTRPISTEPNLARRFLDRVNSSDPSVTDYILEAPEKCPNCKRAILEKTLVETCVRWRHDTSSCAPTRRVSWNATEIELGQHSCFHGALRPGLSSIKSSSQLPESRVHQNLLDPKNLLDQRGEAMITPRTTQ
jgi:hypothetical protein